MKLDKHTLRMIIGCVLPLLLIFLAPAIGLGNNVALLIFIAAMFVCHLLMPMNHHDGNGHSHDHKNHSTDKQTSNTGNHEHD